MTAIELANEVYRELPAGSELKVQSKKGIKTDHARVFVERFYPHFVLTINENGFRECYLYSDLYQMLHGGIALDARSDDE